MLRALIFDVDGTLAETEETHRMAFNRAFANTTLGWVWDREMYAQLLKVAGGKERIRHFIESREPCHLARANLGGFVAGLHKLKTCAYHELIVSGATELRPGVEDLIAAATRDGLALAIATTTTPSNVDALLRATLGSDWRKVFPVVAAGNSVRDKKPAPDIYLHVLKELGLPASSCLAIEDSSIGLRAALGAGIPTIVTPGIYSAGEDATGALAVVGSLTDLCPANGARTGATILDMIRLLHHDWLGGALDS